jgi:hypothetical protein
VNNPYQIHNVQRDDPYSSREEHSHIKWYVLPLLCDACLVAEGCERFFSEIQYGDLHGKNSQQDAGTLCNKAPLLGDMKKWTPKRR